MPGNGPVPGGGQEHVRRADLPRPDDDASRASDRVGGDADELVTRLRARRSATGVAAAYAAAHGHPADPRAEQGARRWALTGTTAVVAVVAVLLLGLGVATLSFRGDGVVPLASASAGTSSGSGVQTGPDTGAGLPSPLESEPGSSTPGSSTPGSSTPGASAPAGGLLVHVVGAVRKPGLVTVPDGARVADALRAAGGATDKADLTAVNLARTVVDGEQLVVPRPGETAPGPAPTAGVAPGAAGTGGGSGAGPTVDINTADALALDALPGVGPSIAQAIVEWRETNGPFADVDELEDVPGIGPATLDELRDSARVGP
ncbi:helix-hairpin-helix domain-containing protein [Promicromonospora sp. NPDC050880]|uniref:helix-hairpin-helix domain-containing protein n=1 Tax=Promicromonospora sp. NPDC050880 TaxID=3364406 RepID=UPI003794A6DC